MRIRFVIQTGGKVNEERDLFLTEAMGTCRHEYDSDKPVMIHSLTGYMCTKCGNFILSANDFSTVEDFMKLYDWAKDQETLKEFVTQFETKDLMKDEKGLGVRKRFADGLYGLLSKAGRQKEHARR